MIGHGLEITTRIGCLNCDYCPQDRLLAAYKSDTKSMSLETFSACVAEIPESVRIHFSGFCEPFLNHDCSKMICLAHEWGHPVVVYTTLVGFDRLDADLIFDIPFVDFAVHVPDEHTHYKFGSFLDGLRLLNEYRINFRFEQVVSPITRAGNDGSVRPTIAGHIACRENRHMQNVLLPNGDVYLCCMDYGLQHRLGNLLTDTYESLFESTEHRRIVAGFADGSDTLCRKCERAYNA